MDTPASNDSRARWSLRLFGGFELAALPGGERVALPGKRERALLSYLALSAKGRSPRRRLSALLWGDAADDTMLDNLRTCVWRLRKALDDSQRAVIMSDGDDIVLDTAAFAVDALAFRRLAAEPGHNELETAANLYTGEFLDGLEFESEEFESWRRAEATRYRQQTIDLLARLMTLGEESGEVERAAEIGLRILELDPLHEAAARRLMRLYSRSGRRGAAIKLYQSLSGTLRKELDSQPEAQTSRLFAAIARSSEVQTNPLNDEGGELTRSTSVQRTRDAPYPSLLPLGELTFRSRARPFIFAAALIATAALISFQLFGLFGARQAAVHEPTASTAQANAISVAILPFVNLSGDAGQDFFSDGMTEEITAALTKVPGLRIVARTSAFQFKGQNRDVQTIGQQLNATYLIEGSVRTAGNRLRITAQLVEADSGVHVWTENYDRELTDIFALQEDIARAIVASLRVPLGLKPGENLVSNRSIDPQSYQLFLQARALWTARGLENLIDSERMLEQVLASNPSYAPGWALLCASRFILANEIVDIDPLTDEQRRTIRDLLQKAESACRQAIALDPSLAISYAAAGTLAWSAGRVIEGEELYLKGLALDTDDANLLGGYGSRLAVAGRLEQALPMLMKSHALEPFAPVMAGFAASLLWLNGKDDEALAQAKTLRPAAKANSLAKMYASTGRFGEAADALMDSPDANSPVIRETIRLLRIGTKEALASESSILSVPDLAAGRVIGSRAIDFLYLRAGVPEPVLKRVLDNLESRADAGFVGGEVNYIWHPAYAPMRKTERFKAFMRKTGYVDYWRVKGWPEFCRPLGDNDFACE